MLHAELKAAIDGAFAQALSAPVELCRDALIVRLNNEAVIELRFASGAEYAIGWRWGDAQLRIDTAPLHPQLATAPRHLHDSEGCVRADPVTLAGDDAWGTARRVIAAVWRDPLLQAPAAV